MGFSDGDATKGQPYGDSLLSHLLGGSSGGGGDRDPVVPVVEPSN